jgi:hypothetical protein
MERRLICSARSWRFLLCGVSNMYFSSCLRSTMIVVSCLCTLIVGAAVSHVAQATSSVTVRYSSTSQIISCTSATVTATGTDLRIECLGAVAGATTTDQGSTDQGSTDQGSTDQGSTDQGSTDQGSNEILGYDDKGNPYTLQEEIAGRVTETLHVSKPKMVIYRGDGYSILYPDCAEKGNVSLQEFDACTRGTTSLRGDVTYVQRLHLDPSKGLLRPNIEFLPFLGGNNDHGSWAVWISRKPGAEWEDGNSSNCAKSGGNVTFPLNKRYKTSCLIPSDALDAGDPLVYINFRPVGDKAENCGKNGYLCRTLVHAW